MSDLVAFLNARLDEDEAKANWALDTAVARHGDNVRQQTKDRYMRVLREVEAKRKILDRCARVLDAFGDEHGEWPDVTRRERAHADFVLCELAAVYSDHPGYQQDWA